MKDSQALGGLRNPHRSPEQLAEARSVCSKLRSCIGEYGAAHWGELEAALQTVGTADVPTALMKGAAVIREKVAESFKTEVSLAEQLQGKLLSSI